MEIVFTERAHLMCPHMCFGIAMSVDHVFDEKQIRESFGIIGGNHPFLNAVLGHDKKDNGYFYDIDYPVDGEAKPGYYIFIAYDSSTAEYIMHGFCFVS